MHHRKESRTSQQSDPKVDLREQLFNAGEVGPINEVATPEAMITSIRGILLDIDPKIFRKERGAGVRANPKKFYKAVVAPMLARHAVLGNAEVRVSGTGLHVIIRFDKPVDFKTESERRRWASLIKVIQRSLPTDPNAPGLTALTRPVGSINSRNGKPIERIFNGQGVKAVAVVDLFNELRLKPFATITGVLFGQAKVSPCPVCSQDGSTLTAFDSIGQCYGCGKIKLGRLFDVFLEPNNPPKKAEG